MSEKKFDWNQHPVSEPGNQFKWDEHPVIPDFDIASGVRNFVQGASLNLSDEIAGGFEAGGRALGVKGLGGPIKDIGLSDDGPTLDLDVLSEAYKEGRDLERGSLDQDMKNHPALSLASQVGGGVMSPFNKIKKLQELSPLKSGAAIGAVTGLGQSRADNLSDLAIDTVVGTAIGGTAGKALEQGGKLVSKGFQKAAEKISPYQQKENTDEIIAAAKALGIKVTPGMLDDSGFVERLESALSKSPSFLGQSVARNSRAVNDRLISAGEELTKDASNLTPFQIGEKFKSGITAKVGERLDPLAATFQEVAEHTQHVPIGDKSIAAITRNIESDDLYSLGVGSDKAQKYVGAIKNLKNANQVKSLMSLLNEDLKVSSGAERQVLGMIKEKLSNLEENSIMRAAIRAAKETGSGPGSMKPVTGEQVGRDIVSELQAARQGYRELSQDLQGVAKEARLRVNNPNSFLDAVEQIPSERIQDKFFNVDNNRQLMALKEKFPEMFDLLRQGKLKDVFAASHDNTLSGQGNFAANRFLKAVRELNPEAQSMLFRDGVETIKHMETIQNSLPRNFNPSGTASESSWTKEALVKNFTDIPAYLLYKGASTNLGRGVADKISQGLLKSPEMLEFSQKNPLGFQTLVQRLSERHPNVSVPRSSENQEAPPEAKMPVDKNKILEKTKNSKFGQVLQNAASRGDDSFNAAHFVLSSRDPEYRKQLEDDLV